MAQKYSKYLQFVHYNKILNYWWYLDLKKKLNVLEEYKIKINISELNKYLYNRYQYEQGKIYKFDDTKYNLENYMQIIIYNVNGYDADDESNKKNDEKFVIIMDGLADKLAQFTMK